MAAQFRPRSHPPTVPPAMSRCSTSFRRTPHTCILAAGFALLLTGAAPAEPQDAGANPSAAIEIVRLGWNGNFQPGRWTPLTVRLAPGLAPQVQSVEVGAPDADGNRCVTVYDAESVRGAEANELNLRFRAGTMQPQIVVRLLDSAEKTLAQKTFSPRADAESTNDSLRWQPLRLDTKLIAGIDVPPAPFEAPGKASSNGAAVRLVSLASLGEIPHDARTMDSLELLILNGRFNLTPAQNAAVREWVRRGGRLLLCVSPDSKPGLTASPLAEWIEMSPAEDVRLREMNPIESYVGRGARLSERGRIPAVRIDPGLGETLIDSLDGIFAARNRFGFGYVALLGIDPAVGPLSEWDALPTLCRKLTDPSIQERADEDERASTQLAETGVSDLATQFQMSQQQFAGVSRNSVWEVLGWLGFYALLIGPLDFLLAHRLWKRPRLTWVTFPLLIVAMTVLTVLAGNVTGGSSSAVNQVDLIDVDATREFATIRSWITAYSARSQRASVAAESRLAAWNSFSGSRPDEGPLEIVWDAIPEDGFRGVYRKSGIDFSSSDYRIAPDRTGVENLPVAQWSTASLAGDQTVLGVSLVRADLKASALGTVTGTVEHCFPGPIVSWILVYRNRVYYPRRLTAYPDGIPVPPNQPFEITRGDIALSRDLRGYLTGAKQVVRQNANNKTRGPEVRTVQMRYDPLATETVPLLRLMTFYSKVDGAVYTGLGNSGLDDVDWSDKLEPDSAVLMGVLELPDNAPAFEWSWNGSLPAAGRRLTVVRAILPVSVTAEIRRELPKLK